VAVPFRADGLDRVVSFLLELVLGDVDKTLAGGADRLVKAGDSLESETLRLSLRIRVRSSPFR
jgi:hypothetical protein